MRNDICGLKSLGNKVEAPKTYDPSVLEAFANRNSDRDYWVTFTAPEFTTLCPKTGQPDFATLTIRYVPAKKLVESKSLKLYLFGFRNHGDFHFAPSPPLTKGSIVIPPRAAKLPNTSMYFGFSSFRRSSYMIFTTSSWKSP